MVTDEELKRIAGNPFNRAYALACEIIAARKVVEAARMVESDDWGTVKYTDDGMWNDAVLLQLALAEYDAATGE